MPVRKPLKLPSIRRYTMESDLYVIRLFARLATFRYTAMTWDERQEWERRIDVVYAEIQKRHPGEPTRRGTRVVQGQT